MSYSGLEKAELSVVYERDGEANVGESPITMTPTQAAVCYAEKDWPAIFRQLDSDNDGYIPFHEMPGFIEELSQRFDLTSEHRKALLAEVDCNGDRRIDFPEFCLLLCKVKRMRLKRLMFEAARSVLPKSQREEPFSYLSQYSCVPPPLFILLITVVEESRVAVYIYYVVTMHASISITGPVPTASPLIYSPCKRFEAWRYLTYMLIHIGIYHIVFNCIAQLLIGLPLELVHKYWRVGLVYLLGVLMGSLAVSVTDPKVYLAGASGGVYALIAAHVANLVVNWAEMEFAMLRLVATVIFVAIDLGVSVYNRYGNAEDAHGNQTSYVAHIGGFVAGLLMGIVILRNFVKKSWERYVWWIAFVGYIILLLFCIFWNIFYPYYPPDC